MSSRNGNRNDHYLPRKPHVSASLYRKRIAREYERSEKITLNGEQCAVRVMGTSHLPYQLIRSLANDHRTLDCWRYAENPAVLVVKEKWTTKIHGVLDTNTLRETTDAAASSYTRALLRFREADEAFAEVGGEVLLAARQCAQQELSARSFEQIFTRTISG